MEVQHIHYLSQSYKIAYLVYETRLHNYGLDCLVAYRQKNAFLNFLHLLNMHVVSLNVQLSMP